MSRIESKFDEKQILQELKSTGVLDLSKHVRLSKEKIRLLPAEYSGPVVWIEGNRIAAAREVVSLTTIFIY